MRGLTAAPPPDLARQVGERLDLRLRRDAAAPIAVAVSGGGDSVALALLASDWARRHGRRLLILNLDHGLNPMSGGWLQRCAGLAARLGADFRGLAWTDDKPRTGLPAAARTARHALLADAARSAGARVILMGHTLDDLAEAALMRATGSTTPDPREWAPSPAWPEGRGLFVLRPMLGVRRADLRAVLAARGETWIEDPANDDPRYARARARATLGGEGEATPTPPVPALAELADLATCAPAIALPREALRLAQPPAARAFVGTACLCAAGTSRPPRRERLERLTEALSGDADVVATLAGARIEADALAVRWMRTAGEIGRAGGEVLALGPGETGVWDGRYEIAAERAIGLAPLAGHAASLSSSARAALGAWPPAARGGLPAILGDRIVCPVVEPVEGVEARDLTLARLLATCGGIEREPA